jgi:exo-beta-1,3-glucanase (GH17 family)
MNNTTETQINQFLKAGLNLHLQLKKAKRDELATAVLAFTSSLANLLLETSSVRNSYSKVFCHCGRQLKQGFEIQFYNNSGDCLSCDSVRGDIQREQRSDCEEN